MRNGLVPVGLLWLLHDTFYTNEPRTLKCMLLFFYFISLCLMQSVGTVKIFYFIFLRRDDRQKNFLFYFFFTLVQFCLKEKNVARELCLMYILN